MQADSLPTESQGKAKKTVVDSLSLLQQIFPTKASNYDCLHCRWILYQLSYEGSPQVRVTIIKKCINKKFWRRHREKQWFYIVCGNVNWYSHYAEENVGSLKIGSSAIELPYDPAMPFLGLYLEKTMI